MIREKPAFIAPGLLTFLLLFVLEVLTIAALVALIVGRAPWPLIALDVLAITVVGICFGGFLIVSPNEAQVLQLFGNYAGTVNQPGFWWTNPFTLPRRKVSQRVRNFESSHLKVNDHDGNPIEIAAIVVWRVTDTAEAVFMVDDYENFVKVQTEAAVRNLATSYAYDSHQDDRLSLRTASDEITGRLRSEVQDRLAKAGIEVIEARLSHLAYAPEIAQAMLRRQQASAVVAARARIVEGAVGMVEMALEELSKRSVVDLDEERKAAMVSNLLVVLCSEQNTQPVVNTGTLYT
ncbi:MAG TPA: SPFH domain-containing protein [Candidatus Limnocylindria bacterium]|jgi:regulator of protease activity HflC (stomatin/prohibitin superfamily)|nr:SPFH domain-containing protein [Candidatus Limnocylindria bacterium]